MQPNGFLHTHHACASNLLCSPHEHHHACSPRSPASCAAPDGVKTQHGGASAQERSGVPQLLRPSWAVRWVYLPLSGTVGRVKRGLTPSGAVFDGSRVVLHLPSECCTAGHARVWLGDFPSFRRIVANGVAASPIGVYALIGGGEHPFANVPRTVLDGYLYLAGCASDRNVLFKLPGHILIRCLTHKRIITRRNLSAGRCRTMDGLAVQFHAYGNGRRTTVHASNRNGGLRGATSCCTPLKTTSIDSHQHTAHEGNEHRTYARCTVCDAIHGFTQYHDCHVMRQYNSKKHLLLTSYTTTCASAWDTDSGKPTTIAYRESFRIAPLIYKQRRRCPICTVALVATACCHLTNIIGSRTLHPARPARTQWLVPAT